MEKLKLIAGPCVIENENLVYSIAENIKLITNKLNVDYFFKASFDKANRSSCSTFRGPGLDKGLNILSKVKNDLRLKILTDIHEVSQAEEVAKVVDVIQIPAFLCRQTDLIIAAAKAIKGTNKKINIKKGQFLAPWDMLQVVKKFEENGLSPSSGNLWLTERGSSFGYNNLIVDFRSLPQMKSFGCPIIFDATHSVQQPGGQGNKSGGQREFVAPLARAAAAVGIEGIFMEVHPNPENALSDGPNMVPLYKLEHLLSDIIKIRSVVGENPADSTNEN